SARPPPTSWHAAGGGAGNRLIGPVRRGDCSAAVAFEQTGSAGDPSFLPGYRGGGIASVPVSSLPDDSLPQASSANAPDIGATSLESSSTADAGVVSSALQTMPLRFIPLRFIPLRFISWFTLANTPTNPTTQPGGWEPLIANTPFAGKPLQDVYLAKVLDPASYGGTLPPALDSLTLKDIDLQASPLRFISIASFVLGATPLR